MGYGVETSVGGGWFHGQRQSMGDTPVAILQETLAPQPAYQELEGLGARDGPAGAQRLLSPGLPGPDRRARDTGLEWGDPALGGRPGSLLLGGIRSGHRGQLR